MNRLTPLMLLVFLSTTSTFQLLMKDAHAHASGSVIVNSQFYNMQPGQTLTQEMRVCVLTGGDFTVNNITFSGNYSNWARVETDFPVEVVGAENGASAVDIPVTVTVPANFTENHALTQAIVEVQNAAGLSQASGGLVIFIRDSPGTPQNLTDCNRYNDLQTPVKSAIIIIIASGGTLLALGYLVYRHSKKNSIENRAGWGAKVLLVVFVILGSLMLLTGLFLLGVQNIF
jgi:hypothetical protein